MGYMMLKITAIDVALAGYFESLGKASRLRRIFSVISFLGSGRVWWCIYIYFLIFPEQNGAHAQLVHRLIEAEILGLAIIIILRYLTKRQRPPVPYATHIMMPWNKYSFPSHHAMRSFMIASLVGSMCQVWLPVLLFMAALVAFSRLYLLKHYLSDVCVGALLGWVVALAVQG